ncbi:hypothetical protein JW906_10215 [bacterium]|nr:hypothetical protein [bacterium]
MKKNRAKGWIALLAMAVLVSGMSAADTMMKQKQHTDAFKMMGQEQPAKDMIQTFWFTDDKMVSQSDEQSILVRLDKNAIYMIDHVQKVYSELPPNLFEAMAEEAGAEDEEAMKAMPEFMKNMMKMKATVQPTNEGKKIKNWNAKKYLQTIEMAMGKTTSEIWATEDIKINKDLYLKFSTAMFAMQPGMKEMMDDMMKEMQKIKGFQVQSSSVSDMMGTQLKSSMELLEYKEGNPPAGTYDIPAGYKQKKWSGK